MNTLPDILYLTEHQELDSNHTGQIKELGIDFCETGYECAPRYLGIHPQAPHTLCASYFIGAEWLTDHHAVVVTPKIRSLDFIEMFVSALKFEPAAAYFSKFYGIDLDARPIKTHVLDNQITPLIVIHFIALLKRIAKRGLKKAYVVKTENLRSRIKGRIVISGHIRHNITPCREDRTYCRYQEYTVDNPENRILKKALRYAESYLDTLSAHRSFATLSSTVNHLKTFFADVSEEVEPHELKTIVHNKIYKEYAEGIRIAKMILRRFNYSISETRHHTDCTPAFWIDMSRLYEVYVYSRLYERYGEAIKFQVAGYGNTAVDFTDTDRKIIIDTKYKPQYAGSHKGIITDIRQIAAYARDRKILKTMGCDGDHIVDCLIIYPEKMIDKEFSDKDNCAQLTSFDDTDNLLQKATPITGFERFYKLSFTMPVL